MAGAVPKYDELAGALKECLAALANRPDADELCDRLVRLTETAKAPEVAYLVSSGSYSDYSIDAVFLSRAEAEEFMERRAFSEHDEARIEEYGIGLEKYQLAWAVHITRDGEITRCDASGCGGNAHYRIASEFQYQTRSGARPFTGNVLRCRILAPTKEHAIKVAAEKHRQLIAEDRWPLDELRPQTGGGQWVDVG